MRNLGVALPWPGSLSGFLSSIDSYGQLVGEMPKMVQVYRDWSLDLINTQMMDGITSKGCGVQVTWEPWDSGSASNPAYSLDSIINGSHDTYIKASAAGAKSYGKPLQLRFAPEMNGSWAPWEGSVNGNTPAKYVSAWKHVVDIFRTAGVTNVKWVWCPNNGPTAPIKSYWPGSSYVDLMSMDGYNWGSSDVWQTWTQVFAATYDILAALDTLMPIQVGETACNQSGGDKAAWITSAFMSEIPTRFPRITDVVWFNLNKECDWRVDSSPGSLTAFKGVVASSDWGGSAAPPPPPDQPPPAVPLTPANLTVTGTTRSTASLTWDASDGATSYTVHRSRYSDFSQLVALTTTDPQATFTGLARRSTYYFRVQATNAGGASPWSPTVTGVTTR